ncbi:MAG: hypothetical protein CMJ18_04165 [Phycisphaeraceae bacterium]|nr:hypothetical protein [Phycisphaeraceae bacterium]
MFNGFASEHTPQCAFDGNFESWKQKTHPRVMATLGDFPGSVDPEPEMIAEWDHDGLRKQRWLIEVGPHASAAFQINYPPDLSSGEKRPTIFCWHGHGQFGKEAVMGNPGGAEQDAEIERFNYDYGHRMAQAGFVTYAIDWMGVGQRNDRNKPNHLNMVSRDYCNIYYLHATMLGMTSISINLAHGRAATDFACTLPHVDPDRLGVMGLSGGGTMTTWTAIYEDRFKAAEIICYSDLWAAFGIRDLNYCGMQVAPGLFKLVDLPDLQGLIAPRPLLIDIGAHDNCFRVDTAMGCFRQLEKIYEAAGASEHLELDLFPGPHAWGANKSMAFFTRHLGS